MRNIYIAVATVFIIAILLFIGSFVYMDREGHQSHHYVVTQDGIDIGSIKIDRYETEDKLIYKSILKIMFAEVYTELRQRLTLDRKYKIGSYVEERLGNGAGELIYLESANNAISFVSRFQSQFAYLENILLKKSAFVFDEGSPMTYLPIIENYDFKRGRAQGFNALTIFTPLLPPMKRFITLTSVRDEYLTVDSKKIKTECMLLKIKNYPQGRVWVAKADRSLVRLEIPEKNLMITKCFAVKTREPKELTLEERGYTSKKVVFKNNNVTLAGTMRIPDVSNRSAALLVWGAGPQDRQYQGFFTYLADCLAKNGFCVLSFDKRGIGESGGDLAAHTDADIAEDIKASIKYLSEQKEVDPQKITLIGHEEGAVYVLKAAAGNSTVNRLILMAPKISLLQEDKDFSDLKNIAWTDKWSEEYLKLAMKCIGQTATKVISSGHDWSYILRKKVYLRNIREKLETKPLNLLKDIKVPVLILQGKEDEGSILKYAAVFDKTLSESSNPSHTLTYFSYLGHFFGKKVNDGTHRIHYKIDNGVLENIKNWMNAEPVNPSSAPA